MLSKLSVMFIKTFNRALRYHKFLALVFCVIFLSSLFSVSKLKTELSMYSFEDPAFPSTMNYHDMKRKYSDNDSFVLVFHRNNNIRFKEKELCLIRKWQHTFRFNHHNIYKILSALMLKYPSWDGHRLKYSRFLDLDCSVPQREITLTLLKKSPWSGTLVSNRNYQDFAMEFQFNNENGTKFHPNAVGETLYSVRRFIKKNNLPVSVYLGGRSAFQWHLYNTIKEDAVLNISVILILILLFRIFLGTWRSGLYLTVSLLFSAVFLLGIMRLLNWPIDLLSNALFLMMCIAGVQDFIFLSHQMLNHKVNWKNHFKRVLTPCFFTSLTTIVGFASLSVSDLPTIGRFGILAALAATIEWIVTFFCLPVLIKTFKLNPVWTSNKKTWIVNKIHKLNAGNLSPPFIKLSVLIFIVSLSGFFFIRIDDHPNKYFSSEHFLTKTYNYFEKSRGWQGIIYVTISNKNGPGFRNDLVKKIMLDKNVAFVKHIKQYKDYFKSLVPTSIAGLVYRQMDVLGAFEKFFPKDQTFNNLGIGSSRIAIFLKNFNLIDTTDTIDYIKTLCRGNSCTPVGEGVVYSEYTNKVVSTLWKSFLLTLLFILSIIVLLSLGLNKKGVLTLIFSAIWGPVVMIGLCALLQIPMNLITGMFITILVGMTGDNAIHYLFASRNDSTAIGIMKRGEGSLMIAIITGVTSLGLLFLTMVPLKMLGLLIACGFLASVIGDQFILKGLISLKRNT